MKTLNIRWRLTLWYGGVLAVVLFLFSSVVYLVMRHQLLGRIDQGLHEELADVLSEVRRAKDSTSLSEWLNRRFAQHEGFDFEIIDSSEQRFFVNHRLVEEALTLSDNLVATKIARLETVAANPGKSWRRITVQADSPDGPLTIHIGRSLASFEHESQELLFTFLITGPITLLVVVTGGYFLAYRTLKPVQVMTQAANRITADRLSERIVVENPDDELGGLAATLNRMVERLEVSFHEMQRFTADAAHELRTPLAVMRNETEVALRSPRSAEDYGRVLGNLLEETNRLSDTTDQLLFLARHDAGLQPSSQDVVPMNEVLTEVISNMQLVANEKSITLFLDDNETCELVCDSRQLRRLFVNLLDNAIKYTNVSGRVSVRSRIDNGELRVVVSDSGVGIPAEHLSKIFDRFYRVDPARSEEVIGTGLGLSICQSVVRGMGGTIQVHSIVSQGTTFTVSFPRPSSMGIGSSSKHRLAKEVSGE